MSSQIVLINNFKNINNSAMKNKGSMKEIVNKNLDMWSNKQIKENAEKGFRSENNIISNVSKTYKNLQTRISILNVILKMI